MRPWGLTELIRVEHEKKFASFNGERGATL